MKVLFMESNIFIKEILLRRTRSRDMYLNLKSIMILRLCGLKQRRMRKVCLPLRVNVLCSDTNFVGNIEINAE